MLSADMLAEAVKRFANSVESIGGNLLFLLLRHLIQRKRVLFKQDDCAFHNQPHFIKSVASVPHVFALHLFFLHMGCGINPPPLRKNKHLLLLTRNRSAKPAENGTKTACFCQQNVNHLFDYNGGCYDIRLCALLHQ